jgi:hypothetical protein
MGKPENAVYERFQEKYKKINQKLGKNQFIVPYLISSHPGSTLKEAIELAEYLRDLGYMPEQVQDFYPTPSTISTCMYYSGLDPRTLKEVYVPKSPHEKAMQRALIQYRNPKNYDLVVEALRKADRLDLIGFDKKCLVRPRQFSKEKQWVEKEKQDRAGSTRASSTKMSSKKMNSTKANTKSNSKKPAGKNDRFEGKAKNTSNKHDNFIARSKNASEKNSNTNHRDTKSVRSKPSGRPSGNSHKTR